MTQTAHAYIQSKPSLRTVTAVLRDLLFPAVCANCRRLGALVCARCEARFPLIKGPICVRCGLSLSEAGQSCYNCRQRPLPLVAVRAPFRYAEPLDHVIHQMKYEGYFALAEPLATLMVDHWPENIEHPDLVVPIPLHSRRQRQRGFNQSTLLASHLCHSLGLSLSEIALRRIRYTTPQIELGPEERANNMQGAFAAVPEEVNSRHVLLIDDVFTTGATLSAAADALLKAGARAVSAYCLASVG